MSGSCFINLICTIVLSFLEFLYFYFSDPYLFAEILMQRPLKLHKYRLKLALNEEDMRYMTYMARKRFDRILLALRQMPKNMLLVIR